jgi:hypothetical protein
MRDWDTHGGVREAVEEVILELLDLFFVALNLLYERLPLLLELALLFADQAPKQLVLQAHHGDGEINERHLGGEFRGVVRVGQARGAKQFEVEVKVHLLVGERHDE